MFSSRQEEGGSDAKTWQPDVAPEKVNVQYDKWKKAVSLTFGLADLGDPRQDVDSAVGIMASTGSIDAKFDFVCEVSYDSHGSLQFGDVLCACC